MVGGGGGGRLRVVEKRHLPPAGVLPVHSGKIFIVLWATCARFDANNNNKSDKCFLQLRIASVNTFASSPTCDWEQQVGGCPGVQLTAVVSESLSCHRTACQGCFQRRSLRFDVWVLEREPMVLYEATGI